MLDLVFLKVQKRLSNFYNSVLFIISEAPRVLDLASSEAQKRLASPLFLEFLFITSEAPRVLYLEDI